MSVSGAFGQQPVVAAADGSAPLNLVVSFLSEGSGSRVAAGVAPLVRYVEVDWLTGKVLHDDWNAGTAPKVLATDDSNVAVANALNGIRLGSRLRVVNPVAGGGATVYVIDVVAAGSGSGTG